MNETAAACGGQLAGRVVAFARLLRRAGMPVGSDRIATALQALQVAGLASRADFHAALGACLLDRAEHRALFDRAFELFWQAPVRSSGTPLPAHDAPAPAAVPQRLGEALLAELPRPADAPPRDGEPEDEPQDGAGWAERERLRHADFETMSADEWRQALRLVAQLPRLFEPQPTRRQRAAAHPGRVDWRGTLAAAARRGGELQGLRWRAPRRRPPPLLLLADISGSMSRYSRMLLHLAHALAQSEARVESFVFGTRLTRTTRLLAGRDPDLAVALVARTVQDWSGGTRIADSLREFNRRWSRRVLPGTATVLLVSDGLEHGDTAALAFEMERLHKSCRRLVWLNPLLRFERFEPRAGGIRAMRPHVDLFLPAHNVASLEQLARVLAAGLPDGSRSAPRHGTGTAGGGAGVAAAPSL